MKAPRCICLSVLIEITLDTCRGSIAAVFKDVGRMRLMLGSASPDGEIAGFLQNAIY